MNGLRQTEDVPDFCSCGAELPPDARFCHKCGKPQREEDLIEPVPVEPAPEPVVTPPVAPPIDVPIGFRNPLAFRIGMMAALAGLFLNIVMLPACPLWLTGSGFLGVYLYQRRSGRHLNTRSGALMGWITGLICFVITGIPVAFGYVHQITAPGFPAQLREQMAQFPFFTPQVQDQMIASIQTSSGIATHVIALLVTLFILFTLFSLLGGMLGSQILKKD